MKLKVAQTGAGTALYQAQNTKSGNSGSIRETLEECSPERPI